MIYNKLTGDQLQWAKDNGCHCEFTKRNLGRRQMPLVGLAVIAGNRSHGFPSRHHKEDPVGIIEAADGSYKSRGSVRKKKMGCKLASSRECSSVDTVETKAEWKRKRKARKKAARRKRGQNV